MLLHLVFTLGFLTLKTFVSAYSNVVVLTDSSVDRLKHGTWLVLVHSPNCGNDAVCSLLRHAWSILSLDEEVQKQKIRLATLDAIKEPISRRHLKASGPLPFVLVVRERTIVRSEELFSSIEDIKRFALNPRSQGRIYQYAEDGLPMVEYGPSVEGLSTIIILCLGVTLLAFFIKGSPFETRSLSQLAEQRRNNNYKEVPLNLHSL